MKKIFNELKGIFPTMLKSVKVKIIQSQKQTRLKKTRGLNLIEIMVVLLIIGLFGSFVFMNLMPTVDDAKIKTSMTQMVIFKTSLLKYKMDNGDFPTTNQGLDALVNMPSTEPIPRNWQRYLDTRNVPKDPWQNRFVYEYPDPDYPDRYLLKSLGSDSKEGGEGTAKDILAD